MIYDNSGNYYQIEHLIQYLEHRRIGETMIRNFLTCCLDFIHYKYTIETEFSPSWANKYRYDFYIPYIKLIVEFDGEQHFEPISNWSKSRPIKEYQQTDVDKIILSIKNNISIIHISRYVTENNKNEWQDILKDKIIKIYCYQQKYKKPYITFIEFDNEYYNHIKLLQKQTYSNYIFYNTII